MKRFILISAATLLLVACTAGVRGPLPRGKASADMDQAFASYLQAVADSAQDIHSIMVLQHGKVLEEKMFVPDTAHILNSVSKTFTATAVGFAVSEGLLSLDDKIVDLKLMRDMEPLYKDGERKTFIDAWGYDIQGFVYQQIVKQNTGKELPFYLAVITKETTPDIEVIHIPQYRLNSAGELVKYYAPKYAEIKAGKVEPVRCGKCDWCKDSKKLVKPLEYEDLIERL